MAQVIRRGRAMLRACAVLALALAVTPPALAVSDPMASLQPEQVRVVQRALQDYGYNVALSGTWDDGTRAAVGSFQSANGLPATGALDSATSKALGVDPWAVTPVAGRMPEANLRSDPAVNCAINNTVDCLPGP